MDMRLRSQKMFSEDLTAMLAELTEERTRFDERFALFQSELEEIKKGAQKEGIEDVQRTIQSLEAISLLCPNCAVGVKFMVYHSSLSALCNWSVRGLVR